MSHTCDACGDEFRTLSKLRLHEKNDCTARVTLGTLELVDDDVRTQAVGSLVTCRDCGQQNPDADFERTTSYDGEDFHLIVEFDCRFCEFANENRIVMEGVDESNLADLPPHLQPEEGESA